MATLSFYVNNIASEDFDALLDLSGCGFYGNGGFGRSVAVNAFQDTTYITDSNGISQGAQLNNIKYLSPASGLLNGNTYLNVQNIPNYQTTLNIRFENDTACNTQEAYLIGYDRTSIDNPPSGVVLYAYETRHPDVSQENPGSGNMPNWTRLEGSTSRLGMANSPGISGIHIADGSGDYSGTRHDYYVALSCSPSGYVGSRLFAISAMLEFT